MQIIRTSQGYVRWLIGRLDEVAEIIFSYGYCASLARVLHLRNPALMICYYEGEDGTPDHFYDILGKHAIETMPRNRMIVEDIELDELDQYIDEGDNRLAEAVIDEYLKKYC